MKLIEDIKYIYDNRIVTLCNNIKNAVSSASEPSNEDLFSLKQAINECLENYTCSNIIFTFNTDKILFGVKVSPTISDPEMINIIAADPSYHPTFVQYQLEIDSKLVENVSGEELAALIMEDICVTMDPLSAERVQDLLALLVADKGSALSIRASVNYTQILIYAFKETLYKVTSIIFRPKESLAMNEITSGLDIKDILDNLQENLKITLYGFSDVETAPKMGCLEWALMIYDDIQTNIRYAEEILNTAKIGTASQLEINEINLTLKCLRRAYNEVINEAAILEDKVVNEISIFKSLKKSGLKSIENDLYEFKMQVKTCVEQEEALFILKQINTRIGILDDYLQAEDISEDERNKWSAIDMEYRALREELVKKKLSMRKNIGYYVDYDKIDQIE